MEVNLLKIIISNIYILAELAFIILAYPILYLEVTMDLVQKIAKFVIQGNV